MTYTDVINTHKDDLTKIANKIKTEIDLFYNSIKDTDDINIVYNRFREVFTDKVNNFDLTYSMSCPAIISNTPYRIYCIKNSIEVFLDLSAYHNQVSNKILEKFPLLDDSLENKDLL